MKGGPYSERVLVLTPMGRDAVIAVALLTEAGLAAKAVADPAQLTQALDEGAAAVLVAEEAIAVAGHEPLAEWLARQPAWSDLPIILLTHHGGGPERNPGAARLAALLGNVTFLERPFHPTTLVSVASTALRGRRRQYETRAHLQEVGEAEARLRVALKAGRLGSWILDLATTELSCTERCKAIFGRVPEAPFTYAELCQSLPEDDRAALAAGMARAVATGADYEAEHRVLWPDGSVHWVEMRARVGGGADGTAGQLIGVALDTTERKRVEQVLETRVAERTADLAASERRFRAVFDSAFQMAVLTQLDGRVVLANRTALDMIGRSLDDVIGLPIWETPWWGATPREARRLSGEFPRAAAGEFVRYEAELKLQPNDARVLDFSLKPVLDDVGAVVQVVAEGRDITDLKRTEASLRQSQKLESIGQLTGGVAHDFNNLLMAVVANLDIVQRRVRGDPKLLRLVEGAIQGAQRGAALTQRLLAFARRQDLQPQVVDVPGLVLGMQRLLEQSLGPQIRISIEDVESSPVLVDPNQLELAVLNLALNARDAMPDGGTITIRFDELEVAAATAGLEPGSYLRLRVIDTGDGMDEATLRRAVEPFFSTKGVGKGTGLGLSMIHGLAVQSGGALRLASQPGSGTTAELLLPLTSAVIEPTEQSDPREPEMTSATILVVDDDALVAMSTAMMLEDLGHQVIEANSGQDALDVLKQARAVDLLLTDHAMPGMTGMELAQRARTLRPELPILLTTGYAELPGGVGIPLPRLTKPYQQAQLAAELAKLLPLQAR
ncbi:MAG: PAS domain-containing protein [Geminicoccaceae bacterium]